MKCIKVILFLFLASKFVVGMEENPETNNIHVFSGRKKFEELAIERFKESAERLKESIISRLELGLSAMHLPFNENSSEEIKFAKQKLEKIEQASKNKVLKNNQSIQDAILESLKKLSNPIDFHLQFPEVIKLDDLINIPCSLFIERNKPSIFFKLQSSCWEKEVIMRFDLKENTDDIDHLVITNFCNPFPFYALESSIKAYSDIVIGEKAIVNGLDYFYEYLKYFFGNFNRDNKVLLFKENLLYKTLFLDAIWAASILRHYILEEKDEKKTISLIKEIQKFSPELIPFILDPYSEKELAQKPIIEGLQKMDKYKPYKIEKKATPFNYSNNKESVNSIVLLLSSKGMDDISLRKNLNIEELPKDCYTVGYYYKNILSKTGEGRTVYEIDSNDSNESYEEINSQSPDPLKEKSKKEKKEPLKKLNNYDENKVLNRYLKYEIESFNKKTDTKSFELLISEEAKQQIEKINIEAKNYINNVLLEIKDAAPSLVKGHIVGATAGNFEKLHGMPNIWEFRITDSKFCGKIGLNHQSRILFAIQKNSCCILYIGDHPTTAGYKMIALQNKELLDNLND